MRFGLREFGGLGIKGCKYVGGTFNFKQDRKAVAEASRRFVGEDGIGQRCQLSQEKLTSFSTLPTPRFKPEAGIRASHPPRRAPRS